MPERPQNFDEVGDESEVTLATPRFDADEARHANPVVPLEEIPSGGYAAVGRARFRAGARRWPLSLIVAALLAVAALGAVAASVLRRAHTTLPAPVSADAAQDRQTQTDTTPAPAVTAPTPAVATPTQSDASAQPQGASAPTAAAEEKTGEEKAEARAPLRAREERAAHTRHDEEALPPPAAERRDVDGEDGGRG